MKKKGFWGVFDMFFDTPAFDVLLVINALLLLLVFNSEWPTMYTGRKPREHQLSFERHNDQLIDEFVRPEIVTKYKVKTLLAKTNSMDDSVSVRIETDGAGRYEEIAEDVLRLAPMIFGAGDVLWSREPVIGDDGTPKSPHPDWNQRQLKYILEFDHCSDDGGVTVFFVNGHMHPAKSTPWHSNDLYNFH